MVRSILVQSRHFQRFHQRKERASALGLASSRTVELNKLEYEADMGPILQSCDDRHFFVNCMWVGDDEAIERMSWMQSKTLLLRAKLILVCTGSKTGVGRLFTSVSPEVVLSF